MSKKITFFIATAALILISVAIWDAKKLPSATSPQQTIQEPERDDHDQTATHPVITVKDITLRECEKRKGYELVVTAQQSKFCPVSDSVECCSVMCNIMRNGSSVAALHAEKSLVDRLARQVVFAGPVEGSLKELHVKGSDLHYDFSTQTVQTDKMICYTHPSFTLQAGNSMVDVNTQKIVMTHGVRSEFLYCATSDNSSY